MSFLFDRLLRRGLIGAIYPDSQEFRAKLFEILDKKPATVYTGFDATAKSLHVGHLATIISSLHLYSQGHQVICLIGDATAQVGDPSGHHMDRKRIPQSVIAQNAGSIESILAKIFSNFKSIFVESGGTRDRNTINMSGANGEVKPPIFVRNSQWFKDQNVIEFLDCIFREVRVGGLLHKKSIQDRLSSQTGMNMAEFCYQIFQGYDWLKLRERYNCKLQIGGNDQQGNIYTGHDLIKKCLGETDSIGLLAPLITNSRGKKIGKTSLDSGSLAIWLESSHTSPYDLYQFFHRTPDNDVEKFLKVFTFYSDDYIDYLLTERLKDKKDIWYCQRKLAEHACLIVHGTEGLDEARRITESLFPRTKVTD